MSAVPAKAKKGVEAPVKEAKRSKRKEAAVQAKKSKAKEPAMQNTKAKATAPVSQPEWKSIINKNDKDESLVALPGFEGQSWDDMENTDPIAVGPVSPQLQTYICYGEGNNHTENPIGSETGKKQHGLEEALEIEGGEKEAAREAQVNKLTAKRIRQLPTSAPQGPESEKPETSKNMPSVLECAADPLPKYMAAPNQAPTYFSVEEQVRQNEAFEKSRKETNLVADAVTAKANVPPHFRAIAAKYACEEASEEENAEVMALNSELRAQVFGPAQDDRPEMKRNGVVVEAGPAIEKSPTVVGGILFPTDLDDDFSRNFESRGQKSFELDAVDKADGWAIVNRELRLEAGDEEAIGEVGGGQASIEDTAPVSKKKSWFWPFL